jgi:hypothetical protein
MRKLNRASSNRSCTTLHQHGSPFDWARDMNRAVGGYTGDSEARALFEGHPLGQLGHLLLRDGNIFGGGAEGTVRLGAVTPYTASDPFLRDSFADSINGARAVAVRNDARIGHADSKRIFALLHIAGINTRHCDTNANLTG